MVRKGTILKTRNRNNKDYLRFIYGIYDGKQGIYYFYKDEDGDSRVMHDSLEDFSEGNKIYIDNDHLPVFSEKEVVSRAREKYRENFGKYHEKINNSEHFAVWCFTGKRYSIETGTLNKEDDTRSSFEKFIDGAFNTILKVGSKMDEKLGLETELDKNKGKITILDIIFFPIIKLGEILDRIFNI